MKNTVIEFFKIFILAMALSVTAAGCVTEKPVSPARVDNCPLPSGNLIDRAFETAKSTLSNTDCRYRFDEVIASLLNVCKGSPEMKNKELFSNFLEWTEKEGIISSIQAKQYYTRYFSQRFVSLPGDYQTCSYCSHFKTILGQCKNELRDKELGLLKVCGDKATYANAYSDLQKIELIFEATCSACEAE